MARKLQMNPDTSYMLGIYRCNNSQRTLCLRTKSKQLVERFVKLAVMSLGTSVDAVNITNEDDITVVELKNSRLRTLLDKALDERDHIFKYKNEYSGSYFAAMFDCNGASDKRGMFIRGMNSYDKIILERIGFHTVTNTGRCYIKKSMDFMMFIAPFSIKAQPLNRTSDA
jgi:hypothetical protein